MARCRNVTDAAFQHLEGIHKLDMSYCDQETITDAAFVHLNGIHTLSMDACNQVTITDAAFTHLTGIHSLNLSNFGRVVSASILGALKGLHRLIAYSTRFAKDDETEKLRKAIPWPLIIELM
jgi:hypothetical protein